NWLFLSLAILGIWLGFGKDAPLQLHWLFFKLLPGFGSFRNPTRTAMVTSLCCAALAAEGLGALRARPELAKRGAVLLALVTIVAPALLLGRKSHFDTAAAHLSARITVAIACGGLALLWYGERTRRFTLAGLAAIAL